MIAPMHGEASDVQISVIDSLDELDRIAEEWDRFVDAALPGRSLFYHAGLLRALAPVHLTGRRSLFVLTARRAGALVGAMPLVLEVKSITRAGVRILSLWASDGSALSLEGDIPVIGDPVPVLRAFRDALLGVYRDRFDVLQLGFVRADSRVLSALRTVFPEALWAHEPLVAHAVRLPTTLDAYRALRSSAQLRKLAQRQRKLASAHQTEHLVLSELSQEDLAEVFGLHTARQGQLTARGRHREFIARDVHRRTALEAVLAYTARIGAARHHLIRADGRLVSFVLTSVYGGTVVTGATAIDEAFAEFGPGTMVFWDVITAAYERGDVGCIEFGPGTTSVKQVFGTHEMTPQRFTWVQPGRRIAAIRWALYSQLVKWRGRWLERGILKNGRVSAVSGVLA